MLHIISMLLQVIIHCVLTRLQDHFSTNIALEIAVFVTGVLRHF